MGEEIGALGAESRQRGGETSGRETSGGPERELARPGPRTGPIVWGALILVFCAYVAQQVFGTDGLDAAGWITLAAIGVGALLLAVGVAVLVRNRSLAKRPDSR
ncbi:hypothetical protein [Leucobacter sp. USHLN153]|uniref:hypothetical protein n=1 Tax=Leucobacter sp. USHLN153 TaxID=3081268 RepID=UPI0030165912